MAQKLLSNILQEPPPVDQELKDLTAHQQEVADYICRMRLPLTESAEALGIDRVNLYRILRKAHVRQYIREQLLSKLNAMAPRALEVMESLLSASDPRVRLKAATEVLDRASVVAPTEGQVPIQAMQVKVHIDLGD